VTLLQEKTGTHPRVILKQLEPQSKRSTVSLTESHPAGEKFAATSHACCRTQQNSGRQSTRNNQVPKSSHISTAGTAVRNSAGKISRQINCKLISEPTSVDTATPKSDTFRGHINLRRKATSGVRTAHSHKSVFVIRGFNRQPKAGNRVL
jgi:hypothetical protein